MKRLALVAVLAAFLPAGAAATAAKFNPDPVFPVGPISETTSHQIAKLTHVASALAGRRATVNCWSKQDWMRYQAWLGKHNESDLVLASGITHLATRDIELPPYVCQVLAQTLAVSAKQPVFEAFAITVLAHESAHASGIRAEHLAECRAIKTEPRAAALLGVSSGEASRLQHIYRGTLYPYDEPRYRTPVCHAGLPLVVVPDTLGSASAYQPLERTAAVVARSLKGWKNIKGADAVGALSPCSPVIDRKFERARFGEAFSGLNGESASYGAVRLVTRHAFARSMMRFKPLPQCAVARVNLLYREAHLPGTHSLGHIPAAITRLSPKIRAHRLIFTNGSVKRNIDEIYVIDSAGLGWRALEFNVPAGTPIATELRATKAVLRSVG